MPIEVIGNEGYTRTVTVPLTSTDVQQQLTFWMQVHNLSYNNKASISINGGSWISLANGNSAVTVEGLGKAFGGIGGGFSTIKLRVALPSGTLKAGDNQVSFRFNTTDGHSIGYRVLKLNFLRPDGTPVVPANNFYNEDPGTWQPPYSDAASIAAGEQLWRTRQLVKTYNDSTPMRARCTDCHAQDGRDLKYFNYSNHSIVERSKFHGLTEEEGKKIASYIRTLPGVPTYGRPWNPPYQPGPGMDAKPVEAWAAGAGVDAVLESDRDLLAHLFPGGIRKEAIATTLNTSMREMPIYMQLPDWNHWLPAIHPMDAYGDVWVNSTVNKAYAGGGTASGVTSNMRERAARVKAAGYTNYRSELYAAHRQWKVYLEDFNIPRIPNATTSGDTQNSRKVYSSHLWHVVKTFEIMQEFGLEGHQQQLYPSSRDARGWMLNDTFDVSPHLSKLPRNNTGINENGPMMFTYFSQAWYQTSLVLFNGNHSDGADREEHRPIDWGYAHGFIKDLRNESIGQHPNNALLTMWLVKGMQVADNTLKPNAALKKGWHVLSAANISRLVTPPFMPGWANTSSDERRSIMEALLSTWWDKTRQFAVSDWYNDPNEGGANTTETINGFYDGSLGNQIWYMLPHFKYHGVNPQLVDAIADWAQKVWPQANWNEVKTASCAPVSNYVRCSTERF